MSQVFKSAVSSTPTIPTSFTADFGSATPASNNLNVVGGQLIADHDDGIWTEGSGDDLTVNLTNRGTGQITTTDDTFTTIVSFTFGASGNQVATFKGILTAMNNSGGAGASYEVAASFRSNGTTATKIGDTPGFILEDASMTSLDFQWIATGNAALLQVKGLAAVSSVNWDALVEYRRVV